MIAITKNAYIASLTGAAFLLFAPILAAQSIISGDITGTVTDPSGASLPNAQGDAAQYRNRRVANRLHQYGRGL